MTLFRPPHGARRPAVLRAARGLGMETVLWNLILGDWHPVPARTIHERLTAGDRAQPAARGGDEFLCCTMAGRHSSGAPRLPTVAAVQMLLERLGGKMEFVLPPGWLPGAPGGKAGFVSFEFLVLSLSCGGWYTWQRTYESEKQDRSGDLCVRGAGDAGSAGGPAWAGGGAGAGRDCGSAANAAFAGHA